MRLTGKFIALTGLLLCFFFSCLTAQQVITIGTGTNTNSTQGPAPVNVYYRSIRTQTIYTATELNDGGMMGTNEISALAYYITTPPAHSLPNFRIRMRHTTASNASAHIDGPYETVYQSPSYTPTGNEWNVLTFSTPFIWNGEDNILVDTAFDMVPSWNASGQQRVFDFTLGMRYAWSDNADQGDVPTNATVNYKPQIQFYYEPFDTYDDDMAAIGITGPQSLLPGNEGTFTVTVQNLGFNVQNIYTVRFIRDGNIELESIVVTDPLAQFETALFEFFWTPEQAEEGSIAGFHGEVVLAGDENPENDSTEHHFVLVTPPPPEGEGTSTNPYLITSLIDLIWLSQEPQAWDKHFLQTADIDASESVYLFGGLGMYPIGDNSDNTSTTRFRGIYNGGGHGINNLYINRPEGIGVGLFGYAENATIKNIRLNNVDITGFRWVGGLVGHSSDTLIDKCYTTGGVAGSGFNIGGLVGRNKSSAVISNSYSFIAVSSDGSSVGGLVGFNTENSLIIDSFSKGEVDGNDRVGGLVGLQTVNSEIINSYSTAEVIGNEYIGGLVGRSIDSFVHNSYWNTETSGQDTSAGGEGRTTSEMTYPYATNTYVDWDFLEIWVEDTDWLDGYPYHVWRYGSPNPYIAVNPQPESGAEGISVTLEEVTWSYQADWFYATPLGFRVYLNTTGEFGDDDDVVWVPYVEDQIEYASSEILPDLLYETTYYWKVVPTTNTPDMRDNNRDDAVNVPVWHFTTESETSVDPYEIPQVTELRANYPNPFNPETEISFSLAEAGNVKIEIFNILGQRVTTLTEGYKEAGEHYVIWNGRNSTGNPATSGIYFYRMTTPGYANIRKMMLLK